MIFYKFISFYIHISSQTITLVLGCACRLKYFMHNAAQQHVGSVWYQSKKKKPYLDILRL